MANIYPFFSPPVTSYSHLFPVEFNPLHEPANSFENRIVILLGLG